MSTLSADATALTARDLFDLDPDALQAEVAAALANDGDAEAPGSGEGGSASRFIAAQAANALDEILAGIELGQLLLGAWQQLQEVRSLIEETRREETTSHLALVRHVITSEHQPSLELVVNGAPRKLLDVAIVLSFTVASCDLVIDRGEITGIVPGPLSASGEVTGQGCTLAKRETGDVDPSRLFPERA